MGARKISLFDGLAAANVGGSYNIPPAQVTTFTVAAFGIPVRVLDLRGDDANGDVVCVSLQQETVINQSGADVPETEEPAAGPLIGITEFGAGGGLSSFEFDIPVPVSFPGNVVSTLPAFQDFLAVSRRNNGILLSLPVSSLRVFVRNDAKAPYLIGGAAGGPNPGAPFPINGINPDGVGVVRVHTTYGNRVRQAHLTRSYPICNSLVTDPFAPGQTITIGIPAYARRVYFPRNPVESTSLSVEFGQHQLSSATNSVLRGIYAVATGSNGPLDIMPYDNTLSVTNDVGVGVNIDQLQIVFELGI